MTSLPVVIVVPIAIVEILGDNRNRVKKINRAIQSDIYRKNNSTAQ